MEFSRSLTPGIVIAAPTSGAGKTTVALSIMATLTARGLVVQPFKCGPDYIDTQFHNAVCGRGSVNLDLFMASADHVRELYAHYAADADIAVVEGMMGMFDGFDRWRGSTAEIARVLRLPILLVVDAKSAGYSLAPLLHGFLSFDAETTVAGVIFNRVGSAKHRAILERVCAELSIPCLGFIPKQRDLETPSRYLGLDTRHLVSSSPIADAINLDLLLEICRG